MTPDRRIFRLLIALVVLVRLLFLNQAVQGDDVYYLKGAEHALIQPLHPLATHYAWEGKVVSMMGHPHGPFVSWTLGLLLAVFGDLHEAKFHALWMFFPILAVWAAWRLARRFSIQPGWAAALFAVTPAFVVNAGSFETDVPFLSCWLAAVAMFVQAVDSQSLKHLAWAGLMSCLAVWTAPQAVLLVPVLGWYLWLQRRDWIPAWGVVLAAPAALAAWQLFEWATTGQLPLAVMQSYMKSYQFQASGNKLKSAAALTSHLGWLVFPATAAFALGWRRWRVLIPAALAAVAAALYDPNPLFWLSFGTGVLVVLAALEALARRPEDRFVAGWIVVFFGAALVLFFAGSARYLLPAALPVAILVTARIADKPRWLSLALAGNLVLGLGLSYVNYKHWLGYRQFAERVMDQAGAARVWINGEWGLRFYLERRGALPYLTGQEVRPGDWIVSSELSGYTHQIATGGGRPVEALSAGITTRVPLRIIALNSHSGYSTASMGLRPFDLSNGPIDFLRAEKVIEVKPELSAFPMNSPQAPPHLLGGVYDLEGGGWRWMSGTAGFLLKTPHPGTGKLVVELYIPDAAPGRTVRVAIDAKPAGGQTWPSPGAYRLEVPVTYSGETTAVRLEIDKTFRVAGDGRELGCILRSIALE